MNSQFTPLARVAALAVTLFALAPSAHALATWNFGTSASPPCTSSGNTLGNTWTCASGSPALTASAWSTTGTNSTYEVANLSQYGGFGFGVRNENEGTGSPEHSMDNRYGSDLIALHFDQAVTLTQLQLGWTYNDSDLSVLAYTGGGGGTSIAGQTAGALLNNGWSLIGNFANVGASSPLSINGSGVSSSWWLVSAYNSAFGGNFNLSYFDYTKLLAVAGTPTTPPGNQVPEPGSLALAAVALGGIWGTRRRAIRRATGAAR